MTDIVATPANIRPLPGAIMVRGIAGAALNVGEPVYKHGTTNQWRKTDANAAATAKGRGIVVSAPNGVTAAVAGDAIDIVTYGPVAGFAAMTPGAVQYISETAGSIADAAPVTAAAVAWSIGWAFSANILFVNPGAEALPGAAIVSLTDNTAGTANDTLQALADGSTYANDVAAIRNNLADLAAKTNAILAALRAQGLIAI